MAFQYRKLPYVQRKISEINPEKDMRIRILGKVIDKSDGLFVIDDGSGKAEIVTDENVELGDAIRVLARVLPLEDGFELRAEIVQDMHALDMDLYKKIWEKV
ncbi:MAG: replication protein RepA [Candidatus Aenigmatarchaeota archaeon]